MWSPQKLNVIHCRACNDRIHKRNGKFPGYDYGFMIRFSPTRVNITWFEDITCTVYGSLVMLSRYDHDILGVISIISRMFSCSNAIIAPFTEAKHDV